MKLPPALLLAFFAAAPAFGGARPQDPGSPRLSAADHGFLRTNGFDPDLVAPGAFRAAADDPQGFVKANRAAYDRFTEWRQDPALMLEADRKSPGSAQKALRQMDGFLRPEQVAPLWSNLKLAPRGVSADVPESAGFDPDRGGSRDAAAQGVAGAAPGESEARPAPPGSGLRTKPPAAPARPAAAPPPEVPGTLEGAIDWICRYIPCAKT